MRRLLPTSLLAALRVALSVALVLFGAALLPAGAAAGGTPNLALTVDAQDSVLYGKESTVKLTASTPAASAYAYNLSYRAVLPAGVVYVAGSASSLAGEPTKIVNQPAAGQTTLLWVNVADLPGGGSQSLDFRVQHSTAGYGVQGNFIIRGDAYAQDDEFFVPAFTATGISDTGGAHPRTAFAENVTDVSKLSAVAVTKDSESTPDDELLRGVHDNQTIYTLTVRTNAVAAMTSVNLYDYLPAGIEFLGCGGPGADHTTNAPTNSKVPVSAEEYPGAGPISVPATSGCVAPVTVQTSTFDPDLGGAAFSSGVYTQVRWTLSTLAANSTVTIRYRAAIPLRRNVGTWPGTAPALSGAQAANLNNNSGSEVADEEALVSYSSATGFYNGNSSLSLTGDATLKRFAEDLAVKKTARSSSLAQGGTVLWDLDLRTSEYRDGSDVVVTDTVPDGLCPVQNGVTLTSGAPSPADTTDCLSSGPSPSVPYTTVAEQSAGTWTITWNRTTDPALAQLAPSTTHRITFPTNTRAHYQEAFADAAPVLSGDVVTNSVTVAGAARVVCANGDPCPVGPATTEIAHDGPLSTGVTDISSDKLTAAGPTLDKAVATTSSDCTTATYTDGTAIPAYRPGDRICWQLRVAYPSLLDSQDDTIVDYLPSTLTFDGAFGTLGETATANDTAGAGAVDASRATPGPGGELRWTVPSSYVSSGKVFERQIATRVQLPVNAAVGDVGTNVFKSSTRTTGGGSVPLRDSAPYQLAMPLMSTQKRVVALNGTDLAAPATTQVVRGGDVVKFQVQLSNTSNDTAAERAEVWDRLPAGVACADVTASGGAISTGGFCDTADDTVKWGHTPSIGPDVQPTGNVALTYSVRVPTTTRPTQTLTSSAGIRQFQTTTNTGGAFTYVPSSNIDPTQDPVANVASASSAATLTGAEPTISESRTTSITEAQGPIEFNANSDATIGETIHYKVNATVPAGITVDQFRVTDTVDARHIFLPGTLALTAGTVPPGGSFGATGSDILLDLGSAWTAPTGADFTYTFEFDAIVADVVDNFRGGLPMTNQAKLGYGNPTGTPARNETVGAAALTTVVEPVLIVDKTVDVGTTPVIGGDIVEYTVKVTAGSVNANPAHETTLVDQVPIGLTPVDGGGVPVADGASVPDGDPALVDGTWNQASHAITFAPDATINPGATNTFKYRTSVDIPPVAGTSLTNTVTARTTNIAGTPALPAMERTVASPTKVGYEASKSVTLTAKTASVTSSASPATLTPGEQTTYTLIATIPANTVYYDAFVRDALPPEMEFDGHLSQVCTAGCGSGATTPTVQQYTPITTGGNIQAIGWDLGDLTTSSPQTRTIELKYQAHLRLTRRGTATVIQRPATAVSTATIASNRTDRVGAFNAAAMPAPSGGFNDTSAPIPAASSTVTTVEPVMGIDKQLAVNSGGYASSTATVHDGDVMHYRVTVRNTGDSPAYDVQVRDVPPAKFRNVVMTPGISSTTNNDPWVAPGDDIGWLIPGPIAPNANVVLDYTVDLPDVTDMKDNDAFTNTATIQHAWGVTAANRAARPGPQFGYRDYSVAAIPALSRSTTAIYDAPSISVNKTTGISPSFPDNGPTEVNKLFTWRVTVTNTSSTAAAKNLVVRDTLPKDWRYEPGSSAFTTGSTANPTITSAASGDQLTWNTTIPLAPNASVLLTYQAKATKASATSIGIGTAPSARHINSATASVLNTQDHPADGNGPFAPAAPDTAYAILAVPVISVAKTPDAAAMPAAAGPGATGAAGNTLDYFIKVKNTGTVAATNVVITDTLPADAIPNTFASGSASAIPATGFTQLSANDTTAVFRIASLPVNGTVDIRVPVRTDPAAAENSDLVNSAAVVSDQTAEVVDTGTFRLIGNADLRASKTAPAAVTAGQNLAYTVGATNLGPSVARDVVLTDLLPATVTFRPSPGCTATSVPAPPGPSRALVTCSFPGVTPVGGQVSATINTRVRTGVATNANNVVTASSATVDPVASNNSATANVDVGELADLSIRKTIAGGTAGAAPNDPWTKRVVRGDTVAFTLTFVNKGPSDALSAVVVDTLPAGLTYVSDTGGCSYVAGTRKLTCPVPSGLMAYEPSTPPDPSDVGAPKSIDVVTTATGVGAQTNSATVSGAQANAEPNPADNTSTAIVTVDPSVHLGVTLSAAATVPAGDLLTYTLTGTNDGKDAATAAKFTQTLPAGTTFVSGDPGCTSTAADKVVCDLGSVAGRGPAGTGPIGSAVRHVTVRVPVPLADQQLTSGVVFSSDETHPTATTTPDPLVQADANAQTLVGPAADLTIAQDAPTEVSAGGSLTYTVIVHNDGPSSATNVEVADQLPPGTSLRAASLPATVTGTCSETGGVVKCSLGTLAPGTSVAITITVDIPGSLAGATLVNGASVGSPVPDPTPANSSSSLSRRLPDAVVIPPTPTPAPTPEPPAPPPAPNTANLGLTKKAEGVARAGRELTYTITATNRGPAAATGVVVTDALVGGVEFKNARAGDGKCGYDAGTVRCRPGTLAVGETVNMRVIVVPSKTGMLVNDALVSSDVTDPDLSDNRAVASNTVSPRPPTTLTVKASSSSKRLRGGQRITYTLKVRNTGKNEAVNVEACDKLPAGMSFTSTKGGVLKGSRLCLTQKSLMPGKTATFKVKVRLSARARKGKIVNRAAVDAENAALQNTSAMAQVVTDGKVSAGMVRGFTG